MFISLPRSNRLSFHSQPRGRCVRPRSARDDSSNYSFFWWRFKALLRFFFVLRQFLGNRSPPVRALLMGLAGPDPQRRRKGTISPEADLIKPSLAAARSVRLGRLVSSFAMGGHLPGGDRRSYGRSLKPFLPYVKTRL